MRIAVYPGGFDPITNGHLDLINRMTHLFDRVIVAVVKGREKGSMFTWDERIELIREAVRRGLRQMEGHVLADNRAMLKLARAHGFMIDDKIEEAGVKLVTLDLPSPQPRVWPRLFRKLLKFGRK